MGHGKAGGRASLRFQQAPGFACCLQRCGVSLCQQRFCRAVLDFTARWMKMALAGDQENYLHLPLPA